MGAVTALARVCPQVPASSLPEAAPDHARPPAPQPGAAPWEGAGGSLEGLLGGQGEEEDWGGKGIESTLL